MCTLLKVFKNVQLCPLLLERHFYLLALLISMTLQGCGGEQVSGGEQTTFETVVEVRGATLRVNNVTGSDAADGIKQPYRSLQYALDQLRPGDVLLVEDSGQAYSSNAVIAEERDSDGLLIKTLRGFQLTHSGTAGSPIVIVGGGDSRPVIDQLQSSSNSSDAVLGLYLSCVSHVVIKNLEIRNSNEAGISSAIDGACESQGISVQNNHIHHIFGEKYVGGIRMMGVSDLLVDGNDIHDIFSNQSPEDRVLVKSGRGLTNIRIQNNRFEALDVGVMINAQGVDNSSFALSDQGLVSEIQVANNVFSAVGDAASLQTQISDASVNDELKTGYFTDIDVYGNVFEQVDSVFVISAGDSLHQSQSTCVFNNTFVDVLSPALDISGLTELEIFNNIYLMPQSELLLTRATVNPQLVNQIAFSDNNLFWNFVALVWVLDRGGVAEDTFPDLASWQIASAHPELSADPDLLSMINDPQFVDLMNADYRLSDASPALFAGRFGMSIGADFSLPIAAANACIERIR